MMKRILEKGPDFVVSEKKRQNHLLTGKLADNKKIEIQQKINILTAFEGASEKRSHTEL